MFNDYVNVSPFHALDDRDHGVRAHPCDHGRARGVSRCGHGREYVYVCVREYVHGCVYESVSCPHECVHAHVHGCVYVRANVCVHALLSFHLSFQ